MKKFFLRTLLLVGILYVSGCILLYFKQEGIIFLPTKHSKEFTFNFDQKYEEKSIRTTDGKILSGLLFKVQESKGLKFMRNRS
jgi:uncharacterized protein